MILLDFIRDTQITVQPNTADYSVTKTNDINFDITLVYYSIKYPLDTAVDPAKLLDVKREIAEKLSI